MNTKCSNFIFKPRIMTTSMANNGENKNPKRDWQFKIKMSYADIARGKTSNLYTKSNIKNLGCINNQQGVNGSRRYTARCENHKVSSLISSNCITKVAYCGKKIDTKC